MSFWVDDRLNLGQLDLIAINSVNDVLRMVSVLSRVQIPPVTQTNQVLIRLILSFFLSFLIYLSSIHGHFRIFTSYLSLSFFSLSC